MKVMYDRVCDLELLALNLISCLNKGCIVLYCIVLYCIVLYCIKEWNYGGPNRSMISVQTRKQTHSFGLVGPRQCAVPKTQ